MINKNCHICIEDENNNSDDVDQLIDTGQAVLGKYYFLNYYRFISYTKVKWYNMTRQKQE